ncbi:hypothetical protein [Sulfuritalea sp.]|uniref:hypothetical protein n=1 Tax=Sulfuritalea sp. TaxID=2480090 RepID=UPI00286E7B01|nr:hypothetical protein [Sulfuritalea sp.]
MKRNHTISRWAGIFLLAALAACQTRPADPNAGEAAVNRALARKALWEEKCRTVAGEKIYRRVEDVEGLLLMKVRPERGDRQLADRMWPGAAFARETSGHEYVTTFLGYEYASNPAGSNDPITPNNRGYINTDRRPGGRPGYRWVEVIDEKDGQRYRYTGRYDEPWKTDSSYSKSYIRFNLDKAPATGPIPRYGVTFEDHVITEDRALGIASSTVKVLDLQTKEVLGELTRYAWSLGPSSGNPSPWLTAYKCPPTSGDLVSVTRQFVDTVLIPTKEK